MNPTPASQAAAAIDVGYVANLARLGLTEDERRVFQAQLADIVAYFNDLKQVDVAGVEPMAHAMRLLTVLRPDEPHPGLDRQAVLENAPLHDGAQFLVPKIV